MSFYPVQRRRPVLYIVIVTDPTCSRMLYQNFSVRQVVPPISGGATPGRAMSNDLAERSTALAQAPAPPCLALRIALLR